MKCPHCIHYTGNHVPRGCYVPGCQCRRRPPKAQDRTSAEIQADAVAMAQQARKAREATT